MTAAVEDNCRKQAVLETALTFIYQPTAKNVLLAMHHATFFFFALQSLSAFATPNGQASNYDISPDVAEKYGCGESCQALLKEANAADLEDWGTNFDFDFYATASNFSGSQHGDVLKIKPINASEVTLPAGVAAYKIQYVSADVDSSPVPATGFIAFPFAVEDQQPFSLVAYAHGTSGVFPGCAPSTSPNLYDYQSWTTLLLAGYAVVATDYAGLGNNYTAHKYVASAANANDTYWSVVAAQKAFPDALSHQWASMGHSQGGGAVWKLSEHDLVQDSSSGYIGGVSVAPVSKLYDALLQIDVLRESAFQLLNTSDSHAFLGLGVVPSAVLGTKAQFPQYDAPWISDKMRQRIELAKVGQMCDTAISSLAVDLRMDAVSNRTVESDTVMAEFQRFNAPAQGNRASKPLLLVLGASDSIVSLESGESSYSDACAAGNPIHMSVYPGLDHSAVLTASAPEILSFLEQRFANATFTTSCVNETKVPFDLENASAPLDDH